MTVTQTTKDTLNENDNEFSFDRKELRRLAKKTGRNIHSFISDKAHQADELREKGEQVVKTHPYQAVAAAAVGGLLLGALLRRK